MELVNNIEHTFSGQLGHIFIILSFVASLVGGFAAFLKVKTEEENKWD